MRSRKSSDSPSGYDRDVYPLRARHGLTEQAIRHDQAAKLTRLNDASVRCGGVAVSLMDPRDVAGTLEAMARNLRLVVVSGGGFEAAHDLADAVAAQATALRLSLARSEMENPHTEDAA